jgi:hypothetical protein
MHKYPPSTIAPDARNNLTSFRVNIAEYFIPIELFAMVDCVVLPKS